MYNQLLICNYESQRHYSDEQNQSQKVWRMVPVCSQKDYSGAEHLTDFQALGLGEIFDYKVIALGNFMK